MEHFKKGFFWFLMLSGVTKATSLSESTQDFLKLSFHMFPYNKKVFKSNIWLDIWNKHPKIPRNAKFLAYQWRDLGVTSIWHLGFCCQLKYRLWRPNYVIAIFRYHPVEYIKLDTSTKFQIIGAVTTNLRCGASCPLITDGSKKSPWQIG